MAAPGRGSTPRTRTVTNPSTGRTVTLGGSTTARPTPKNKTGAQKTSQAKPAVVPNTPRRSPRDVVDDWRLSASERTSGAGQAVRRGAGAVGTGVRASGRRVLAVRLPHWPGVRGVLVTAVVSGLAVVALGAGALAVFKAVFGVKSGGGWGVLAFALIAVAAFLVSRTLLRWFGHSSATVVAALAQLVGIVLLLILLPTNAQSLWSLLIVPAVAVTSHLVAHGCARIAEAEDREAYDDEPADAGDPVSVR